MIIINGRAISTENWPVLQDVKLNQTGDNNKVAVTFPETQPVSGTVGVNNFPATQPVSGTVTANVTFPETQPISGTVAINSLPAIPDGENNIGNVAVRGSNAAAHESVTVADSAIGFTALTYGTNTRALISCETAQIRFTIDGTTPTSIIGHILDPGDILELDSAADIAAFMAIRTSSVSGIIRATFSEVV